MKIAWKHPRTLVILAIGALLVAGLLTFRNYGMSWDEKTQYVLGYETYETVVHGMPYSTAPNHRFHGPVFEFLLYAAPVHLGITNPRMIFFARHLITFLLYFGGVVGFVFLLWRYFRNWWVTLAGILMLVLHPRIYGHAFFNARDVPTMAMFIITITTLLWLLERPRWERAVVHGIFCAVLISLRMTGVLLPMLTLFFLAVQAWNRRKEHAVVARTLHVVAVYAVVCILATICFWPLLWTNPLGNFIDAYRYMSSKSPDGFYMGARTPGNPWHWIPVWVTITTPLLYTALFVMGFAQSIARAIRSPLRFLGEHPNESVILLWLLAPLTSVIVFRAGIFDEWRHVYFIYPAMIILALQALLFLWKYIERLYNSKIRAVVRNILIGALGLTFAFTALQIVRNHPVEYASFSVPKSLVEGKFELDYWGLSFRQGLEWILKHDPSPLIPVYPSSSPGFSSINLLTAKDRLRIVLVKDPLLAYYVLDNYRWSDYKHEITESTKIHSVYVDGIEVMGIYQNPYKDSIQFAPDLKLVDPNSMLLLFSPGSMK